MANKESFDINSVDFNSNQLLTDEIHKAFFIFPEKTNGNGYSGSGKSNPAPQLISQNKSAYVKRRAKHSNFAL